MKKLKLFLSFAFLVSAVSVASVSAQNYADGPRSTVEHQVLKKLIGLPHYGIFDHITFQVQNGTVILGGEVFSLGTKSSAASLVKRIPGVSGVVNNIRELPPSGFDNTIRRQALRSFVNSGLGRYFYENNPEVRIIVENGRLTLEGYVANRGDYNLLNILAKGVPNTFQVTNNLIVGKERNR